MRTTLFTFSLLFLAACTPSETPEPPAAEEPEPSVHVLCSATIRADVSVHRQFQAADADVDVATSRVKDQACAWLDLELGCGDSVFPTGISVSFATVSTPDETTVTAEVQDRRAAPTFTDERRVDVETDDGQPEALRTALLADLCRAAGAEPGCTEGPDAGFQERNVSCSVSEW